MHVILFVLQGCLVNQALYDSRLAAIGDADGDGQSAADGDCNDEDAATWSGAEELCDGVDNDCDDVVDDSPVPTHFDDADGDGHGDPAVSRSGCAVLVSDVLSQDDCAPSDPDAYPGAAELPYDGVDQDCDGSDLDDVDGDGAAWGEDCVDEDAAIGPGTVETWADGWTDNDCDGVLTTAMGSFGDVVWPGAAAGDGAGPYVSRLGDIDGDGVDEFLSTSLYSDTFFENGGLVHALSGSAGGSIETGYVVEPGGAEWYMSVGMDGGVDVDGDGVPDLLLAASGRESLGAAFLVSGAALADERVLRVPDDALVMVEGDIPGSYWGSDVRFVGDVDGDGLQDFAVSASYASVDDYATAGRVAVFSADGPAVRRVEDADQLWEGYYVGGRFGEVVMPIGDVDYDGIDDVLIGAASGDIAVVVAGTGPGGSLIGGAIARITRDGTTQAYRPVAVGDVDDDGVRDIAIVGGAEVRLFTRHAFTSLLSQDEHTSVVRAPEGSVFADALDIGDETGDGTDETALSMTWHADLETAWIGLLAGDALGAAVSTSDLPLQSASERPASGLAYRLALVERADATGARQLVTGGPDDDQGGIDAGVVVSVLLPE